MQGINGDADIENSIRDTVGEGKGRTIQGNSIQFSHFSHLVVSNYLKPLDCRTPGFPIHHQLRSLIKLMSIGLVMSSNHLILCHPLLRTSIMPIIWVFSSESVLCIMWTNYWSFTFSISPSNEYSGLISFRMDWLDILPVKGTLKSLLQHYNSKASIL